MAWPAVAAVSVGRGYLPFFALGTALAGGAIAAVSLATRPQRALMMFNLRAGVPYGAAITIGGIVVLCPGDLSICRLNRHVAFMCRRIRIISTYGL